MNFLKFFPRSIVSSLDISSDIHSAIIGAIINIFKMAEDDTALLLLELSIKTATGTWLDTWGSWFGVNRTINEADTLYSARILASLENPKVTISAIKGNVASYLAKKYNANITSDDITVFEPFNNLKTFSQNGAFSGDCRFPDGVYWRNNVIDIYIPKSIDNDLINLVNKIKAAGIQVFFTETQNDGIIVNDADSIADLSYANTTLESTCLVPINSIGNIFSGNVDTSLRKFSGDRVIWKTTLLETDVVHNNRNVNPNSPILHLYDINDASTSTIDQIEAIEYQPNAYIKIGTDT